MKDGNIMERGATALVNFGYEVKAIKLAQARPDIFADPVRADRLKRQAANVRMVSAALSTLNGREYALLDGMYITGGPGKETRLCETFSCDADAVAAMTEDALRSFFTALFGNIG